MPLTAGTRLGPYEIVSAIGAGGRGEVYRATVDLYAVPVTLGAGPKATFVAGTPVKLFGIWRNSLTVRGRSYDVARDGKRFLVIKADTTAAGPSAPFVFVVNWIEELKAKVRASDAHRRLAPRLNDLAVARDGLVRTAVPDSHPCQRRARGEQAPLAFASYGGQPSPEPPQDSTPRPRSALRIDCTSHSNWSQPRSSSR